MRHRGDAIAPARGDVVDEEHVRTRDRPSGEQLGGTLGEYHRRHGPELLAALHVVQPFQILGPAGMGEQRPVSERAGPELGAALEPGHDRVVGEGGRHGLGDVVAPFVGHSGPTQPPLQFVVGPAPAQVGPGHGSDGFAEVRGELQRGAQGRARVPRRRLHPDPVERAFVVQAGVGYAVECRAPGHGQVGVTGALVQPAREVEQHLLGHPLHAGGQIGVLGEELPVGASGRCEARPVHRRGAEPAVPGGEDRFAELGGEPRGSVGGERHDLVLVAGAAKTQVRRRAFVGEAEGVRKSLVGQFQELAVAVLAQHRRLGFAATVRGEDGAVTERRGEGRGRGVGHVVPNETDDARVQPRQRRLQELRCSPSVERAQFLPAPGVHAVERFVDQPRIVGVRHGVEFGRLDARSFQTPRRRLLR